MCIIIQVVTHILCMTNSKSVHSLPTQCLCTSQCCQFNPSVSECLSCDSPGLVIIHTVAHALLLRSGGYSDTSHTSGGTCKTFHSCIPRHWPVTSDHRTFYNLILILQPFSSACSHIASDREPRPSLTSDERLSWSGGASLAAVWWDIQGKKMTSTGNRACQLVAHET